VSEPSRELQTLKADFFRSLAHPLRIRILEVLAAHGERTVGQLQEALGVEQPIVSQHLAKLRASGAVETKRVGTTAAYALANPLTAELLRSAKQILSRRLTGAQTLLRELRSTREVR
jgi:DNA-binding transcriptional ArsR family regulator